MFNRFSHKAQGSILVISTLMLAMLAGLTIGTLQNVVTEYQLSAQDQDKALAMESAQYALAEAKRLLLTDWSPGEPTCPQIANCYPGNSHGLAVWSYNAILGDGVTDLSGQPASFFNKYAQATASKPLATLAAAPRYFVIDLGCDTYSKANIYRIVAQGYGQSINTVAYAESQLTMPLTGQNSYVYAPTTSLMGVMVQSGTLPARMSYSLAPSTNSADLFFTFGSNTCSNPGQSKSSGATCEMNCLGEVRVKAYASSVGTGCPWIYGDWVPATNQSVLQMGSTSLSCGPCQIGMAVPTTVCSQGYYNSCTGNCVVCTGGEHWNGSACACPANQTWSSTNNICQCNAGYYQTGGSAPAGFTCGACPAGQTSTLGSSCSPCPANTFSATAGSASCTSCGLYGYSPVGSTSCSLCTASDWNQPIPAVPGVGFCCSTCTCGDVGTPNPMGPGIVWNYVCSTCTCWN